MTGVRILWQCGWTLTTLACSVAILSGIGQDFQAEGSLRSSLYGRANQLEREYTTAFSVTVSGCKFKIHTLIPGTTNYFEWSFDGENYYRILSAFPGQQSTDLVPKPPIYTLFIEPPSSIPADDGSMNQYIWLALASPCYLRAVTNNRLAPIWTLDDPTLRSNNFTMEAALVITNDILGLPLSVSYLSDGTYRGHDTSGKPLRIPLKKPFDVGFTNAHYEADTWISLGSFSVPKHFVFTRYFVPLQAKDGLRPRHRIEAVVTEVDQTIPSSKFDPSFTGTARTYDRRFTGTVPVALPVGKTNQVPYSYISYHVTNGNWPSNQGLVEAKSNQEASIINRIQRSQSEKVPRSSRNLVLIIIVLISLPFGFALWKGLGRKALAQKPSP